MVYFFCTFVLKLYGSSYGGHEDFNTFKKNRLGNTCESF